VSIPGRDAQRRPAGGRLTQPEQAPAGVDPATPSPARMYDYMLSGKHNFQSDRDAVERFRAQLPDLGDAAWANRAFHQRAARWLAAERGIRQFIDIGSGLPLQDNTHEIVQAVAPAARVVYVDHDPMLLAYADELLTADGSTAVIQADLRDPDGLLNEPGLRALINFAEPAGLLMTAVMQFIAGGSDPWGLVARYVRALAADSYLALSHITGDALPPRAVQTGIEVYANATQDAYPRSKAGIERFFEGLEIVPPHNQAGREVTYIGLWGAEDVVVADSDGSRAFYCGVARCP
jgi:hypothetical protein